MKLPTLSWVLILLLGNTGPAKEISSNGAGGGDWSDPATWRGKKVPGADDDAVVQKGDTVVFDRNDDGKTTCQKLLIDPKGALLFKTGAGKHVLCVSDGVECYGTLRLDGSKSARDKLELRLLGDAAENRTVKILKGGALVVSGRKNLPKDGRNVALTSPPFGEKKQEILGVVDAEEGTVLDVQWARIAGTELKGTTIDNTGGKANERLNIIGNQFTGEGRVLLIGCDTPVIAKNTFTFTGASLNAPAISITGCPLAEVRDNTIRGAFVTGIMGHTQTDSVVAGNSIAKCTTGMYWYGADVMIKKLSVRDCTTGLILTSASGLVEEATIENCKTAYHHGGATAQLTSCQLKNLPKDGVAILYGSGPLTLLNCNILPAQINMANAAAPVGAKPPPRVTCLQYLVVKAKGAPEDSRVEVRTSNPAPVQGAADLNVRNAPAALSNGLTPLPKSLKPLIVKSWLIDPTGKTVPAPEYTLTVLAPAAKAGAPRPVLKTMTFKPLDTWHRPKPDAPTPTLEVALK
jgi:hypothetical protein